ncbi:spore germination protein GerW family protein [Paenibacillus sp. 1A_MP2]|uniref:spore germination protein GerW family protein n=1 Tax=Paenibacillus sp. 1A_MP2 TaxID=3457495 RepID=UPI003FCDD88A
MSDHPIQGLMETAMENIKAMVDVNTIVGDAVETPDGTVILPISKVGFGFAAGGSDFHVNEGSSKGGSGEAVRLNMPAPLRWPHHLEAEAGAAYPFVLSRSWWLANRAFTSFRLTIQLTCSRN